MKIKLNQLIADFLNSKDEGSHEFKRLRRLGVRGCRAFNMEILGALKTVLLDINANKTVSLPEDYLSYSKMGVINDAGEIVTFTRNDQLANYHAMYTAIADRNEGLPLYDTGVGVRPTVFPFVYYNYWMNGGTYNLFGLDSGTAVIGTFKIDEDAGVILLNPDNTFSQVVFEYVSTGYDENGGDFMIDARAEEAFICYLRWQNAIDLRKKFSSSDVRGYKIEYYREKRLAKQRINPVIISQMVAAKRASVKLVARA